MVAMALADADSIAVLTGRARSTIRWWASKGWLERKGTGPRGRALYDVDEAAALATRLALDNAPDVHQHRGESGVSVPAPGAGGELSPASALRSWP